MAEDPLHRLHRTHTKAFVNQQYHVWKDTQPPPIKLPSTPTKMTSPIPSCATSSPKKTPPLRHTPKVFPLAKKSGSPAVLTRPSRRNEAGGPPRMVPLPGVNPEGLKKSGRKATTPKSPTRKPAATKLATTPTKKKPVTPNKKTIPRIKISLPEDPMEFFDRIDGNSSGRLSLAELDKAIVDLYPDLNNKPAIMRAYKHTDTSGDGFVCRDEFSAFLQFIVYYNNLWGIFAAVDTDNDRRISKEEFESVAAKFATATNIAGQKQQDPETLFGAIDRDGKGMILFAELCYYLAGQKWNDQDMNNLQDALEEPIPGEKKTSAPNKSGKKKELTPDALHKIAIPEKSKAMTLFDQLDDNASGKLSLAELDKAIVTLYPHLNAKAAIMRAYKSSDASGDGFVVKAEFMDFLRYIVYYNNLWDVFMAVDEDGDRRITREELAKANNLFTSESADAMFDEMDRNGGGMVLFAELCRYIAKHPDSLKSNKGPAVRSGLAAAE